MGIRTSVDVVPFAVHSILWSDGHEPIDPMIYKLSGYVADDYEDEDDTGQIPHVELNGWKLEDNCADVGKRNRISSAMWSKGEHVVHVVNESEYAAGGYYNLALAADTKEAVLAFLSDVLEPNDIKIDSADIEANEAIQQTC